MKNRGQISVEYLIVVAFVSFLVITILGIGYFYSTGIKDQIKFNQLGSFSSKIVGSAESIFYAGEPSRLTVTAYLPPGVTEINVSSEGLRFNVTSSSGLSVTLFTSKVPLNGTISPGEGVKVITLVATDNGVDING